MLEHTQIGNKFFVIRTNKASKYVYNTIIVEAILVGSVMSEIGYIVNDFIDTTTGDMFQGVDSTMVFKEYQDAAEFSKTLEGTINEAEAKRELFDTEMQSYQKITIGEAQLGHVIKFIKDLKNTNETKH